MSIRQCVARRGRSYPVDGEFHGCSFVLESGMCHMRAHACVSIV